MTTVRTDGAEAADGTSPAPDRSRTPRTHVARWALSALAGTGLAVAVTTGAGVLLGGATPDLMAGDGPPWWAADALRVTRDVAGALTLGLLLLTSGLLSPVGAAGSLQAPPWRRGAPGTRLAAVSALLAALAGTGHVLVASAELQRGPILSADLAGDLGALLRFGGFRMLGYAVVAWLLVAVVAGRARRAVTLRRVALGAALATALVGVAGHAGDPNEHEAVVGALAVHALAASAWAGGLAGLLLLRAVAGDDVTPLLPRYSALAGLCFAAVAASGVVLVLMRADSGGGIGATWGLLVALKVTVIGVLAGAGHRQRRSVVARAAAAARLPWHRFVQIAAVELVLMCLAAGVGVALSGAPTRIG